MKPSEAASLLERLRSLPPKKRRFLERKLEEKGVDVGGLGILPRLGPRLAFPMSHTQERLWFLHQLDPESVAYNIWSFHELWSHDFDYVAMHRALAEVVRRHEILRTGFAEDGNELIQRVEGPYVPELPIVDLAALSTEDRHLEARDLRSVHRGLPFDLSRPPLLRLAVLRMAADDHTVILTIHHVVSDAWSLAIFHRDLTAFYDALRAGGEPEDAPLPELPIQYGDYVHWQRQWLAPRTEARQLDYWRRQLAGAAALELPTDRPRPRVQTSRGGAIELEIPSDGTARMKELCRRQGATFFVGLLAVYQILLLRYSNQENFAVGSPIAGRHREELEELVGFFANTIVLRTDLGGNPTFRDFLGRVRRTVAEAQENQDVAFARLVHELQPERRLSRSPLFQAIFSMLTTPAFEGTESWNRFDVPRNTVLFDLDLELLERSSGEVTGWLYYNADLFDAATAWRMRRHCMLIFARAVWEPDRGIWDLDLLGSKERWQLVVEWNDTAVDGAREPAALHHGFLEHTARGPDAIAVVDAELHLSYRQLAAGAQTQARRLERLGAGLESRVGVLLEPSAAAITAILGALEAGGAWVPFDPRTPRDRLAWLLDDSGVSVLVTRSELTAGLPASAASGPGYQILLVDDPAGDPDPRDSKPPSADVTADHLAYVLYTSGSTGRPKAVACSHRGAQRLLADCERRRPIVPGDGCALWTRLTFDVSVYEIFSALNAGGRLEIVPEDVRYDGELLTAWLADRAVASAYVPAFALADLAKPQPHDGRGPALRRLLVGVEPIPVERLARLARRLPGLRVINGYGPTEATICATLENVGPGAAGEGHAAIGRPVEGTVVHLVDRRLMPVPIGVVGELVIGGDGLARGYLGRAAGTAERFVPDARSRAAGARLYRTGDLVRRLSDGRLLFQGRQDFQVKIRGHRVELGEIRNALAGHPAVAEAEVVVRELGDGDRRLEAFFAPRQPGAVTADALREHLRRELPAHMVPAVMVAVDGMPRAASDKVDRDALLRLAASTAAGERDGSAPRSFVAPDDETGKLIAGIWREALDLERVGAHDNFFDLGGHSLLLAQVRRRLSEELGREISILDLFRHPTVAGLAEFLAPRPPTSGMEQHLAASAPAPSSRERPPRAGRRPMPAKARGKIAIVGMSARFPGSHGIDELWQNLADGVEAIRTFPDHELVAAGFEAHVLQDPRFVKAGTLLEDADCFDAELFSVSPREAQLMDPQQRIFLEGAWEALESAGCDAVQYPGDIGIFAGIGVNRYWRNIFSSPREAAQVGELQLLLGNDKDFLPTRVSYKLGLTGPSVNVQTACSTSLVATHLACRSLADGECDVALAGGVSLLNYRAHGYYFQEGGILSPDGHCRAFDARGGGTVGSNGMGIVVLKRLDDALADGDTVYAVILGSAINNDGHAKIGYTAPSIAGQARVIAAAQAAAGVEPETVSYVETHGSATPLGDPIEVAALKEVFGTGAGERCALGSIKTNIGHPDAAAGVAGLIKTALALTHGRLPPSLHFETPNPEIDFEHSPFYVNTRLAEWPGGNGSRRRAGVSSFGLGGTNVHMVLEEAPAAEAAGASRSWQLVAVSAASEQALETASSRLAAFLEERPDLDLADAAFTLQTGRRRLAHRRVLVARDRADALRVLRGEAPRRLYGSVEERAERSVAFLFPGLGDHYPGMARELYAGEAAFRDVVDRGCAVLEPLLGLDLRTVIFEGSGTPAGDASAEGGDEVDLRRLLNRDPEPDGAAARRLDPTRLAHPAVLLIELAVARLLEEWGVRPRAMLGYSLGEYAAACVAGVISEGDALRLVAERARLIDELPRGAMLAVPLAEDEIGPLLGEDLALAATHGPGVSVVAGPRDAVEALATTLASRDVTTRRLRTHHAFHSPAMGAVAERFLERVRQVELHPPRIPYLSNVTGTWIRPEEATDPDYWVRHMCSTVRFAEGLGELLGTDHVLLEVGPGQALSTSAAQHPAAGDDHLVLRSLRDARERRSDVAFLITTLGRLWLAGVAVDWRGFWRHERRRRIALPTYPFERRRFWLEPAAFAALGHRARHKRQRLSSWFYAPSWRLSPPPPRWPSAGAAADEPGRSSCWLVLADPGGVATSLAQRLRGAGHDVELAALAGAAPEGLDPRRPEPYETLLRGLRDAGRLPQQIVHCFGLTSGMEPDGSAPETEEEAFETRQDRGLYSLLALVRAMARQKVVEDVGLTVVSNGLAAVSGSETLDPDKATLLGALTVISQEYRNLHCRAIDVDPGPGARNPEAVVDALLAELGQDGDKLVAYRGGCRWVRAFAPLALEASPEVPAILRPRGVYLITGGFGRIGAVLAAYLAEKAGARLVLVGRTPIPERERWDAWLAEHPDGDDASLRIRQLRALEVLGAEVLAIAADVADREAMAAVIAATRRRFGAVHGALHLAGQTRDRRLFAPVESTDPELCRHHFRAKVWGSRVLAEVTEDLDLDFRIVFSSLSPILGGLDFAAYAAANSFVDAFAHQQHRNRGGPWLCVNWEGFRPTEETAEEGDAFGASLAELTITPRESREAFERLLSMSHAPQVVVSTGDLEARIRRWVDFDGSDRESEAAARHASGLGRRPRLQTPYAAPSTERQRAIVELWQDLLGIEEIGIHDSFFELGGDSLLATQLISRFRQRFQFELPMHLFFNSPSVDELARAMEDQAPPRELSEIAATLSRIKALSDVELEEALRETGEGPSEDG